MALLGFTYRLRMGMVRPELVSWTSRRAGFWDDAVAGRSALQAALMRNFVAEAARWRGEHSAMALWDIEKFYDSLDLVAVSDAGRALGTRRCHLRSACRPTQVPEF